MSDTYEITINLPAGTPPSEAQNQLEFQKTHPRVVDGRLDGDEDNGWVITLTKTVAH